jgi:hypothetical protein
MTVAGLCIIVSVLDFLKFFLGIPRPVWLAGIGFFTNGIAAALLIMRVIDLRHKHRVPPEEEDH